MLAGKIVGQYIVIPRGLGYGVFVRGGAEMLHGPTLYELACSFAENCDQEDLAELDTETEDGSEDSGAGD